MNYTTYLRWGVITGLFATLFIPFIVADGHMMSNLFFPYITGKNFLLRMLIEIVAALYIILAIRDPKYRPRAGWLMWTMLAFVAWMALATITSADPVKSFWSNFERMEGYVTLLHLAAYFVIAGAVLTADGLWERFFKTSVGASMAMGFYALLQGLQLFGLHPSSQSGARADTTFGNATYLAVYMLINIFITLYLLARRGRISSGAQSAYGLALVLQFVGLYFTETRGAFLGAIGGIIVAAIWVAWRAREAQWKALRRTSIGAIVAIIVLAGGFLALRSAHLLPQTGTLGRLASISLNDPTTRARLFSIWPMALKGAMERPVTGWGQENFSYVFNEHYTPDMWSQEQWFDRAHNQFLDWMIAGGVPAFLLYVALFCLMAWAVIRTDRLSVPQQAVMLGLLAGYAFNNLFVFDNITSYIYFFAIAAFVHGLAEAGAPRRAWASRPVGNHAVAIAAPVVAIAVAVGGWALNAPGLARASTLVNTLGAGQDPSAALDGYRQALGENAWPGTPMGYQETVEQLVNYAGSSVASSQASDQVKQDFFALSTSSLAALSAMRPGDARTELFASGLYAQYGQFDEAIAHAQKALELSPGKQQILFQLGLSYLNAKDMDKAMQAFKTAYDEAPEDDQALIYYAMGLYYNDQKAQGDALITGRFGSTVVDNDQLLQAYTNLHMYDRVIAIWKLRVEKDPKDLNTRISLAGAYYSMGDKANTIATLKAAEQVDPSKAGAIEQLIQQVNSLPVPSGK